MRIHHLKTSIERHEYAVDADKVAEAIVEMLLSRSRAAGAGIRPG